MTDKDIQYIEEVWSKGIPHHEHIAKGHVDALVAALREARQALRDASDERDMYHRAVIKAFTVLEDQERCGIDRAADARYVLGSVLA